MLFNTCRVVKKLASKLGLLHRLTVSLSTSDVKIMTPSP